jgi:hypothetical protein
LDILLGLTESDYALILLGIDCGGPIMETFDLLDFQQQARETCCPKKLFELWEDVCQRYERKEIGAYQLEEMKEVIWPNLQALALLRQIVNGNAEPRDKRIRRFG